MEPELKELHDKYTEALRELAAAERMLAAAREAYQAALNAMNQALLKDR